MACCTSRSGLAPCTFPFAQVTMTCPPPICLPIKPEPVKPLQLPCPQPNHVEIISSKDAERFRYDNFYNNYNKDYRRENFKTPCPVECKTTQNRHCEDYMKNHGDDCLPTLGCPTGFKPCSLKLTSSTNCDPCGAWKAQIQPCPPKPKKQNNSYEPRQCTRPCCKHWKPEEACLYDERCKAYCFNHPPGIKPSGRFP